MNCQNCGKEFIQNPNYRAGIQKFCSNECRQQFFSKRFYERLKSKSDLKIPRDIFEKLQALANEQQDANGLFEKKTKCEVCEGINGLVLHHIKYTPWKSITLCRRCHSLLHIKFLKGKRVAP
jgi:hypothetical protein